MNREEIAAQVEQERKTRAEACMKDLQAVLEKHSCELVGIPQYIPDSQGWKLAVSVQLVAK